MKQIQKFLKAAFKDFKYKDKDELSEKLGLNFEDFTKLLDGELEITPTPAVKIGEVTGIEPRDLMELVTEQALVAAGAGKRKPKQEAQQGVSPKSGKHGSQSPSFAELTKTSATL